MPTNGAICLAGCGRMGQPMLAALLHAGFQAQGFDIRPAASYGDFAGHMCDQANDINPDTRVLISVVRDVPQTDAVLFGAQGFLQRLEQLECLVISSTLSPRYIDALKARIGAVKLVDAPMSGAAIAAKEARLSFMLGGADQDISTLMPMFRAMGKHFHHMAWWGPE